MATRPNILFLMSDQHNAGSMGVAGHPNVKTPTLDGIAARGVRFTRAYCNNPICAPSRISFVTGQYPHTHRILGNNNFDLDDTNSATLGATLRRHGYETAMVGKGHMVAKWDREAYEHLRYCDLCDADRRDLTKHHYFRYLIDHGLADRYEDGTLPPDHEADPYEMHNRWYDPAYSDVRMELMERLYDRVNRYARKSDFDSDAVRDHEDRFTFRDLVQKKCNKWSDLIAATQ